MPLSGEALVNPLAVEGLALALRDPGLPANSLSNSSISPNAACFGSITHCFAIGRVLQPSHVAL